MSHHNRLCLSKVTLMLPVLFFVVMPAVVCAVDVPLYRVFEETVINNNGYGNRFIDVNLTTSFTHVGTGQTVNFHGFFDGDGNGGGGPGSGNVWRFRFMPDKLGTWNYTWSWSDSTSGGSGSFECVAAGAGKGVIKAYQNNTNWFAYNGTEPVFLKSYYVQPGGVQVQDFNWVVNNVYQKIVDRGYNHMQLGMLPTAYGYQYFADGPATADSRIYTGTTPSTTQNLDWWHKIDQHMTWLNDRDIGAHFFQGIHGKDESWRGTGLDYYACSSFERDFLIKYICARLAPYANIMGFTFTYETSNGAAERDMMDRLGQYDPWGHHKTMMQGLYSGNQYNNDWWDYSGYTFVSTEAVYGDRNGCNMPASFSYDICRPMVDRYNKPVFHSECWGMWRSCYGACNPSVGPHAWANTMAGASATWNDLPDCELGNHSYDIFSFSDAALAYDVHANVMMNYVDHGEMNPYDGVNNGGRALAEPGKQYLVWKQGGGQFNLDVASGSYEGRWINCYNGNEVDLGMVTGTGGSMSFTPPFGGTDAALVLSAPSDPDTVLNLSATAVSTSQIDLIWELQPGSGAQNYRIERKLASGSYAEIAQVNSTATSYNNTGLEAGSTYVYRMRADLGGGNYSEYSNEASGTTFDLPPAAPSNLTAQASDTALEIALAWVDNADNEEGFAIERKSDGAYSEIATVGADIQVYTDSSALAGETTYFYRVRAYNSGGGQYSAYSNEAWDTTPCVLDPQIIDDADIPPLVYSGSWTAQTGWAGRYNETIHESETGGAYVEVALNDVAEVNIYGDLRDWGGTADVTIDSVSQGSISYQGASADSVLIATITGGLGCGDHTLRITVNGVGWCYLDYIEYTPLCCTAVDKVPADPTNLTATAAGSDQIDLSWQDNSGDDADAEDSFTVERSDDGGSSYSVLATVGGVPGTGNMVSYSDTGLPYVTTFCYRVLASNVIGDSGYTAEVCEPTGPPADPTSPTGLSADAEAGKVTLTWNANPETDPAVLYYIIDRSTTEGGPYTAVAVSFGGTNIIDFRVSNGTTYYYRLRAVDTWGHQSGQSAEVSATPSEPSAPESPSNLQVTGKTDSQISLSWTDNADNEDAFIIERKLGTGGTYAVLDTVTANVTAYDDTGLESETAYCYRVKASNGIGDSGYSNEVCDETTGGCVPDDVTIDDADPLITYTGSWSAQSGWSGRYEMTLHETESNGAMAEFSFEGNTLAIISETQDWGGTADVRIDGISQGTMNCQGASQYQVTLFSKNDLSDGAHLLQIVCEGSGWVYVDAIQFTGCVAPPPLPEAPTNLTATSLSSSQIRLEWTDNAAVESGFRIERKLDGGSYSQVGIASVDAESFMDVGLAELTTYYYRVQAFNASGNSSWSNEASATTPEYTVPQFQTADIGGGWGSITEVPGGYDLVLAGREFGGHYSDDNCFFAYTEITGDFDVSLQVEHQTWAPGHHEDFEAKAGIMARWSTASNAEFCTVVSRGEDNGEPVQSGYCEWRWVPGGTVINGGAEAHAEYPNPQSVIPNRWLRLQRVGDEFFTYIKANPSDSWTLIKHAWSEFPGVPDTLLVGLTGATMDETNTKTIEFNVRNLSGFGF